MTQTVAHQIRIALITIWLGWIAYTCFDRAIRPPKDLVRRWGRPEIYKVNRNPIVRIINLLAGLLVLAIGVAILKGE